MTEFKTHNPDFEAMLRSSFAKQGVMAHIGAQMGKVSPGYCEIRLPYSDDVSQQYGFFHGGIVGTIADSAGGYAAFSLMADGDGILTVEYKINLIAPADGDMLIARGQVIRPGRSLTVCSAEVCVIKDGKETPCAVMQQTLMRIVGRADVSG
jgi:uncharacterized protein (TIGR00369 family)